MSLIRTESEKAVGLEGRLHRRQAPDALRDEAEKVARQVLALGRACALANVAGALVTFAQQHAERVRKVERLNVPPARLLVGSPARVQRRRVRGWRMPPNTVYVGRPGIFGNPFVPGRYYNLDMAGATLLWCEGDATGMTRMTTELAVDWYRWLVGSSPSIRAALPKLRGKNLACFCPLNQPCHADVLLELANQ